MAKNSQKQINLTFLFVARQVFYAICIAFFPYFIFYVCMILGGSSEAVILADLAASFTVPIGIIFFIIRIILAKRKLKQLNG